MRALVLTGRRYHAVALLALTIVEVLVWRVFRDPIGIPGRGDGIESIITPLVPVLLAIGIGPVTATAHLEEEIVLGLPVAAKRVVALAGVVSVGALAVVAGNGMTDAAAIGLRNSALLVGISLIVVLFGRPDVAWIPVVALSIVTWLLGSPAPGEPVPAWAILLHERLAGPATMIAAGVFATGSALYVARERPFPRRLIRRRGPTGPDSAGAGRTSRRPSGTDAPRPDGAGRRSADRCVRSSRPERSHAGRQTV